MAKNTLIRERAIDILRTVKVNNSPYLKSIKPFEQEPDNLPAMRYVYLPHSQGQLSTSGLFGGESETGVWDFNYSWLWEFFVPVSKGISTALEEYEEFDVNMGLAFMDNPSLGGLVPLGVSIEGRQEPSLQTEKNRRYLLVQYNFRATAEEGQ
jgi:hypothetical protein